MLKQILNVGLGSVMVGLGFCVGRGPNQMDITSFFLFLNGYNLGNLMCFVMKMDALLSKNMLKTKYDYFVLENKRIKKIGYRMCGW